MCPEMDCTLSILPFDISFFHLSVLLPPHSSNKFLLGSMLVPFGCLFPNRALQGRGKESHSSFGDGVAITAWHVCTYYKID